MQVPERQPGTRLVVPVSLTFEDTLPSSGRWLRWHASESTLQKRFKQALASAEIHEHASVYTLRYSLATHLLARGTDIRTIQLLLGHRNLKTKMIYTQVEQPVRQVTSPLDHL